MTPELAALQATAPQAYESLLDAYELAQHLVAPEILDPARSRIDAGFGIDVGDEHLDSDRDRAIADLADQFVMYVAGTTRELLEPVEDAISTEDLHELVKAMYTIDAMHRLRLVHQGLFAPEADPRTPLPSRATPSGVSHDGALKSVWREATRMADSVVVDPEIIEFLRLRCAWYHDCHT